MIALKAGAWEFMIKALEFLDLHLGLEYISTPMPLLWRVVRESKYCSAAAQKLMISRLLHVYPAYPSLTTA